MPDESVWWSHWRGIPGSILYQNPTKDLHNGTTEPQAGRDPVSTTFPLPTDPDNTPSTGLPSRRDLLLGGAAVVGGLAGNQPASSAPAPSKSRSKWDHEYTFGHSKLFMDQYHEGILGILSKIAGETELVGELTSRAARVVRGDHTVWTAMNDGHMPHWEQRADRRGSPKIMKDEQGLKQPESRRHAFHQPLQQAGAGRPRTGRLRGGRHRLIPRQRVPSRRVHRRIAQQPRRPEAQGRLQRHSPQPHPLHPGTCSCAGDPRVHTLSVEPDRAGRPALDAQCRTGQQAGEPQGQAGREERRVSQEPRGSDPTRSPRTGTRSGKRPSR